MARRFVAGAAHARRAEGAGAAAARLPCADPAALGALLSDLEPRMTALALRYTRDRDSAHDVVQSAFEKVCRNCRHFRGQSRVSTWVHRIVANEALMWLRSERRRGGPGLAAEPLDGLALADPAPSPAEIAQRRQQIDQLRETLAALGPDERDVMRRCALEGWSYEAYARLNGLRPAAVKSRAFRARRRLGRLLPGA